MTGLVGSSRFRFALVPRAYGVMPSSRSFRRLLVGGAVRWSPLFLGGAPWWREQGRRGSDRSSLNKLTCCLFLTCCAMLFLLLPAGQGGEGKEKIGVVAARSGGWHGGFPVLVWGRDAGRLCEMLSVLLPRRETTERYFGTASFNKRGWLNLLLPSDSSKLLCALAGRGGEEKWRSCEVVGEDGGDSGSVMLHPADKHLVVVDCGHELHLLILRCSGAVSTCGGSLIQWKLLHLQRCSYTANGIHGLKRYVNCLYACMTINNGNAKGVQDRCFMSSKGTMFYLPDDHFVEDAVLPPFGLCHQRWTTISLLLIPRFNGKDPLRLSSVMVPRNLQLSPSKPRVHTPDRPSGEPPAGHQLVWSTMEAPKDCRCSNIESGLSTDGRSLFGSIGNPRYHLQGFRSSFVVAVHLGTFDPCSTLCRRDMLYSEL